MGMSLFSASRDFSAVHGRAARWVGALPPIQDATQSLARRGRTIRKTDRLCSRSGLPESHADIAQTSIQRIPLALLQSTPSGVEDPLRSLGETHSGSRDSLDLRYDGETDSRLAGYPAK